MLRTGEAHQVIGSNSKGTDETEDRRKGKDPGILVVLHLGGELTLARGVVCTLQERSVESQNLRAILEEFEILWAAVCLELVVSIKNICGTYNLLEQIQENQFTQHFCQLAILQMYIQCPMVLSCTFLDDEYRVKDVKSVHEQ